MRFKSGVEWKNEGVVKILLVAESVYHSFREECVVTSLMDGRHMKTSLHYKGQAVDLRTWYFTAEEAKQVTAMLATKLGDDYDVILEIDHIHCEYDPK